MIIYKIQNKINNKIYIGKTKKKLSRRIAQHIFLNKAPVQKALNKYGIGSFDISIIDYAESEDILFEKERYWIAFLECKAPNGYNLTDGGEGMAGYKFSQESRDSLSKRMKGFHHTTATKEKIRKSRLGKKLSEISKEKVRQATIGHVVSQETKDKIRKSVKANPQRSFLGKRHSKESNLKNSLSHKGSPSWNKGKKKTETGEYK